MSRSVGPRVVDYNPRSPPPKPLLSTPNFKARKAVKDFDGPRARTQGRDA